MSDTQDQQRAPPSRRGLNLLRRRNRPKAVDEEGPAVGQKKEWWRKARGLWTSKSARSGTKDVGPSVLAPNSDPRDDGVASMTDDMHEGDAQVGERPQASEHSFVRGEDTSTPSTQNEWSNPTSHSTYGRDEVPSITASVADEDIRIAQHFDVPQSVAGRSGLEREEQPPTLESTPRPIFTSPLTPSLTLQTSVGDLNTAVQQPLNGAVTAVFSGAQSITIENVYITVGHGNTTNLVAENVRWSIRENDPQFEKDQLKGAVWGVTAFFFL